MGPRTTHGPPDIRGGRAMTLTGKVAMVTGASRGIGLAVARRLAADGVVVNYSGRADQAQAVVGEIVAAGGKAVAAQADVSQTADVARLFDAAFEHFGRLDILVNNAGLILYKPLADTADEEVDRLMAVNVRGTFLCC